MARKIFRDLKRSGSKIIILPDNKKAKTQRNLMVLGDALEAPKIESVKSKNKQKFKFMKYISPEGLKK